MGISGSGKSTLLHMLSGIIPPTSGKIFFNNQDLSSNSETQNLEFLQKSIGLVFQTDCLLTDLTVLENVMIKGLIQNHNFAFVKEHALNYLEYVGLKDYISYKPNILSGGQKQRISIARALYGNPSFLLLDEPTAHLDAKNKELILDLILQAKNKFNMGLVMTCHDFNIASQMDIVYNIVNFSLK